MMGKVRSPAASNRDRFHCGVTRMCKCNTKIVSTNGRPKGSREWSDRITVASPAGTVACAECVAYVTGWLTDPEFTGEEGK